MGEIINFPTPSIETAIPAADERLSRDDVALLTGIRDNVETLLDMMAGIRRDPEAVAWRLRDLAWCVCTIYMVLQQRWDSPTAAPKQQNRNRSEPALIHLQICT